MPLLVAVDTVNLSCKHYPRQAKEHAILVIIIRTTSVVPYFECSHCEIGTAVYEIFVSLILKWVAATLLHDKAPV